MKSLLLGVSEKSAVDLEVLTHDWQQSAKTRESQTTDAQYRLDWLESRAGQLEKALGLKTPPPPNASGATAAAGSAATCAAAAHRCTPGAHGAADCTD